MPSQRRVAVITGASSGIGRAAARAFARDGYHVVLVARREHELDRTLQMCGGRGRTFVADVADRDQVRAVAGSVAEHEGVCHVLVNSAGIGARVPFDGPDSLDVLEDVMRVNFFGPAYMMAELLPLLEASAPGSAIVNVSSVAGLIGSPGSPMYCASKFALTGMGESLHLALRGKGVQVATVQPGPVPTEGFPHERLVSTWRGRLLATDVDSTADLILRSARAGSSPMPVRPRLYHVPLLLRALAPRLYRAMVSRAAHRIQQPHRVHDSSSEPAMPVS